MVIDLRCQEFQGHTPRRDLFGTITTSSTTIARRRRQSPSCSVIRRDPFPPDCATRLNGDARMQLTVADTALPFVRLPAKGHVEGLGSC